VITESLARQYFPSRNPLGEYIQFPSDDGPSRIVGVVGDSRAQGLRQDPGPTAYTSLFQSKDIPVFGPPSLIVRLSGEAPDFRKALAEIHPALRFGSGTFIKQQIESGLAQARMLALLSTFFAAIGLLLACIGVYGVIAYTLARRTNELGVRMALGARPRNVVAMVLRECTGMVLIGLLVGVAATMAMSPLVRQFMFGLRANDPATIAAAAAILLAVAVVAAFVPARRASRLDPLVALRAE
jgi:hypothetical protein